MTEHYPCRAACPRAGSRSAGISALLEKIPQKRGIFDVRSAYSGASSGELPLALFLGLYFLTAVAQLTAYRVLMVWVYDRTESLLVAVLMHATLIVSTTPILVPAMTGVAFLTWFVALTVALWVVVAAVAVSDSRQLSGQQIRVRPV